MTGCGQIWSNWLNQVKSLEKINFVKKQLFQHHHAHSYSIYHDGLADKVSSANAGLEESNLCATNGHTVISPFLFVGKTVSQTY